jgi:hypothetical protein
MNLPPEKCSTRKKTSDVKCTATMEEILVVAVLQEKAHLRTNVTVEKKYELVKACLCKDRDFAAYLDKTPQAFQKIFHSIVKSFKTKYAFDAEGANLSCLDPEMFEKLSSLDQSLYDMCYELAQADEKNKLLTEKEREKCELLAI